MDQELSTFDGETLCFTYGSIIHEMDLPSVYRAWEAMKAAHTLCADEGDQDAESPIAHHR